VVGDAATNGTSGALSTADATINPTQSFLFDYFESPNIWIISVLADGDGDGIPDHEDECPASDLSATVVIDGCDSGVENHLLENGCTISDLVMQCAAGASNHDEFVSCVAHMTNELKKDKTINGREKGFIDSCAARANIP
jgi:hypothetical protein